MLVLKEARLVYLANPKTATQSLRAMLRPFAAATPERTDNKHIGAVGYNNRWKEQVTRIVGASVETVAVMREPLAHLGSWYRYRQRDALRGHENGTHHVSFAEFITAYLSEDPPAFARIGRQARFLGLLPDATPPVDYIFDYDRLDLLMLFLSERLGKDLALPTRNVSPGGASSALYLPSDLLDHLHQTLAIEFETYGRVHDQGVLETRAG